MNDNSDSKRTTQPDCRNRQISSLVGQKMSPVLTIRGTRCRKAEADQWYLDDGDIMCHLILVLPSLQDLDVANTRLGAERNPLKTEVIYYVKDLDAAPPEWIIGDVRSLAKTSAVSDGSITLGVAVGSRQFIADQLLSKADVIRAMHERVELLQDPQTEFSLRSLGSVASATSCGFTAAQSWRNRVQRRFTMKLGNVPSNGSSPVSRRTA